MNVLVIGGGAAGLMAAISAANEGASVTLLEKNEKLGKKIYITGKGRCNLTNSCDFDEFFSNIANGDKFMYSSFRLWSNDDMTSFLESNGLPLKTERGKRVFPKSDRASDVTKTLEKCARDLGIKIKLKTEVSSLLFDEKDGEKICIGANAGRGKDAKDYPADKVIVATGGKAYPSTGSTGDGYRWANDAGHRVNTAYPSLVGIDATFANNKKTDELAGLSLKNVRANLYNDKKMIASEFGEMLFTHKGVSGPIIITLSSIISGKYKPNELKLYIDFKPALSDSELDARLLREFDAAKNKSIRNVMRTLLPETMIDIMLEYAGVNASLPVHEITKEMRKNILTSLKHFEIKMIKLGGFDEAIITRGGICTKEINPSTMESKKIKGLYFAGEVIDIDAFTGGFNLQLAWSTGYAAGKGAANE